MRGPLLPRCVCSEVLRFELRRAAVEENGRLHPDADTTQPDPLTGGIFNCVVLATLIKH